MKYKEMIREFCSDLKKMNLETFANKYVFGKDSDWIKRASKSSIEDRFRWLEATNRILYYNNYDKGHISWKKLKRIMN